MKPQTTNHLSRLINIIILVTILGMAFFFRFYQLNRFPAEFHYDEWQEAVDAIAITQGDHRIFSETNKGREPLFTYLVASAFMAWGQQVLPIRIVGALAGFLAVVMTYPMVRELFRKTSLPQQHWLATLSMLGLAIGYWQVHHTRIGLRHTLLPLAMGLLVFLLWRGLNTHRRIWFILTGLCLGGSLYTYPASRVVPIFLLLFFSIELGIQGISGRFKQSLLVQHWQNLFLTALTAGIVFAPLGYYFWFERPDLFVERANEVSVFSQAESSNVLYQSILGNLAGFAIEGDERSKYNLPGKPIFDPLMAVAFVIGLGIVMWQIRQPQYLFILLWWLVMLAPAMLVADRIPAFKRAIGIAPGLYILPALAFIGLWQSQHRLSVLPSSIRYIGLTILVVVVYGSNGYQTYRDYFFEWGPSHPHYEWVEMYDDITAHMYQDASLEAIWIFPRDPRNRIPRYRRIDGFLRYPNLPASAFILTDERAMFSWLTEATTPYTRVVLVDVKQGQEAEADHKKIYPFLFEKYGTLDHHHTASTYDLYYYTLDQPKTTFQPGIEWQPLQLQFGESLRLTESAYGDASGTNLPQRKEVSAGEIVWLVLHWQTLERIPGNYKASVRLVDSLGYIYYQADTLLTNALQTETSGWHPTEEVYSYHLIPLEPQIAPGQYQLELVLYADHDSQPVAVNVDAVTTTRLQLGQLEITPALTTPPLIPHGDTARQWEGGIQLVNHDPLPDHELSPGDRLDLSLLWQTTLEQTTDLSFNLLLNKPDSQSIQLTKHLIGHETYPTHQWRLGEMIEQRFPVQLPADLEADTYQLQLVLDDSTERFNLGSLAIQGQPRQFELPSNVQQQPQVMFGEQIRLVGLDMALEAGHKLRLTLYWQAMNPMTENYKTFVHILDAASNIVIQRDQIPADNQRPTTSWLSGEVITDQYLFTLTAEVSHLAIGLYNEANGQRLSVPQATDNRLLIPLTAN